VPLVWHITKERQPSQRLINYLYFVGHGPSHSCEPMIFKKTLASEDTTKWKQAMDEKCQFLLQNNTWSLSCLQIKTKGVANGYKIRLIQVTKLINLNQDLHKGVFSNRGIDYIDTFF
jgi:hypothetical protein